MPIYEFYCPPCNVIFSFFSSRVNTEKLPLCPRCGGLLDRQMSGFAIGGKSAGEEGGDLPDFDCARMEKAMAELAGQAEGLDENDSRRSAGLLRRLTDIAGMSFSEGMDEAVRRMEAGEDPEAVEQDMGGLLDNAPFVARKKTARGRRPPRREEKLYDL